jgi:16S rRNA C967 or C1407 C5-methylase (RsmB/RsmF family)
MVKPGGRLIYSTCAVEREENEEVIEEVLASDERFKVMKTTRTWPQREGAMGSLFRSFREDRINLVIRQRAPCPPCSYRMLDFATW